MYGISETGATQNYIKVNTNDLNKVKTNQGPRLILPDKSIMKATHKE